MLRFVLILSLFAFLFQTLIAQTDQEIVWLKKLNQVGNANSVKFSSSGDTIANGAGQIVQLRDSKTGDIIDSFDAFEEVINCITFSSDSKTIFAGAGNDPNESNVPYIFQWDLLTGEPINVYEPNRFEDFSIVKSLDCSIDGNYLAAIIVSKSTTDGNHDVSLFIWDTENSEIINSIQFKGSSATPNKIKFSKNGLYAINRGSSIQIAASIDDIPATVGTSSDWHNNEILDFAFSDNGKLLVTAGANGYIKIWNIINKSLIKSFIAVDETYKIHAIAFSKDSKNVIIGNYDLKIIQIESENVVYEYPATSEIIREIDISYDNDYILTASGKEIALRNAVWGGTIVNEFSELSTKIYPNPTSKLINIEFNSQSYGIAEISIISYLGKELIKQKKYETKIGVNNILINISHLNNGIYFVKIVINGKQELIKFVKFD